MSVELSQDPDLRAEMLALWAQKLRDGETFFWDQFLKRVDPATIVQELTVAGGLEAPDVRAAILAARSSTAAEKGLGKAGSNGAGGSNGSGK